MRRLDVRRLALLACVLVVSAARSAEPPAAAAEIDHLLGAVSTSGCGFERNGLTYDAAQAAAHLRHKYELMAAAGRIASTEDFIARAASVSSMTGRPYHINCPRADPEPTGSWLLRALRAYRKAAPPPKRDGAAG